MMGGVQGSPWGRISDAGVIREFQQPGRVLVTVIPAFRIVI
jgi:hypothetical protein